MTIKQIREKNFSTWVKCSSIEQGQQLGKFYYKDDKGHTWENFDFNNHSPFYCYIAHEGGGRGGWNADLSYMEKGDISIDFSDIEWEGGFIPELNYQIY